MIALVLAVALAVYPGTTLHRQARSTGKIRELGAYQLRDLLSKGGMGEVWRGEHRLLARPAAIKLIRPRKFANATPLKRRHTVQRFEREARITASLRSPHTVELYDFGVTDDGSFYNVMELLDGLDLKTLVRKHGPLPPERAMHFLAQACDSLAEAHARSLVLESVPLVCQGPDGFGQFRRFRWMLGKLRIHPRSVLSFGFGRRRLIFKLFRHGVLV